MQDGIKANLFKLEELTEINFLKKIFQRYKNKINKSNYKIATNQIIRDSIDSMIKDLIINTKNNLKKNQIRSFNDMRYTKKLMVDFSENTLRSLEDIRYFLKTKMYNNKSVLLRNNKGKVIIKK